MNNIKEIGTLLRKARTEKSIDLSKVSDDLKIRKKYLEYLESGDHSNIPGKAYIKGYIKMYSEYLGIGNEIQNLHEETKPLRKKFYNSKKLDDSWIVVALFTILILVLIILIWYRNASNTNSKHKIVDHLTKHQYQDSVD